LHFRGPFAGSQFGSHEFHRARDPDPYDASFAIDDILCRQRRQLLGLQIRQLGRLALLCLVRSQHRFGFSKEVNL
jgi:hypothetical protein